MQILEQFDMIHNKRNELLLMIAAVVIVVAGFFLFRRANVPPRAPEAPKYPAVVAPKGQLVAGFPKEFILDEKARISGSYSIDYKQSINQYTATFASGQKMLALYDAYLSYFSKNGWTVTNKSTKYSISRGIYAQKGANEASVAIVDEAKSRQVTVGYLVK